MWVPLDIKHSEFRKKACLSLWRWSGSVFAKCRGCTARAYVITLLSSPPPPPPPTPQCCGMLTCGMPFSDECEVAWGGIFESCVSNLDIVIHVMFTLWSDKWRCWLQCVDASLLSSEAKTMPVAWKMSPPPPHFGNRRRTKLFKQKRLQQKRAVGDSEAFLLPFSELRRVPVRQVAIAVMDHYVWQLQHTIIIALFILSKEIPVQRGISYLIPHSHVWSASLAL